MKSRFMLLFLCVLWSRISVGGESPSSAQFQEKYLSWKTYVQQSEIRMQSTARSWVENKYFKEIVDMGPPILPLLVETMEKDPDARVLWHAIRQIGKVDINGEYDKAAKRMRFHDYPDLKPGQEVYVEWWKTERLKTGDRFFAYYARLMELNGRDQEQDKIRIFQEIEALGIPVLPYLMDYVNQFPEWIPIVSRLTDGAVSSNATADQCWAWWEKNQNRYKWDDDANVDIPGS